MADLLKSGYFKKQAKTIEIDGEQKTVYPFVITDESVDRSGDRVIVAGLNLENYKKNPVVFKNHNRYEDPIGNILQFDKVKNQVIGYVNFHGLSPESQQMERYVNAGVYNAGSMGFRVTKSERVRATPDEKKKYKVDIINNLVESELFEFSIVNIPDNPNAVQLKEYQKMFDLEKEAKEKGLLNEEDNLMEDLYSKAGATLNKANKAKLKQISDLANEILASASTEDPPAKSVDELIMQLQESNKKIEELELTIKELIPVKYTYEEWIAKQTIN